MISELQQALDLLKSYSCLTPKIPQNEAEKQALRQAITLVCQESESENLGICAETVQEAQQALASYLQALGYSNLVLNSLEQGSGPVYVKFNTQKQSPYLDSYDGPYRGVLIAFQSDSEAINGTYGYFPLDLFENR
ncbi:DUF1824 family protein [Synechocystis sp. LKSZ1]|uniref:DUF1824 family protein n=1 Tax=Synechocystis sp. LKSZ1 TaxID=3144951 RepID=UPI00336BD16D